MAVPRSGIGAGAKQPRLDKATAPLYLLSVGARRVTAAPPSGRVSPRSGSLNPAEPNVKLCIPLETS